MKKIFLVIKAEIEKQQKHDYHSAFVYLSLLIWPILGFLEVYYTYKPFRFLYNGIIIKHQKTEPTYTKTSLFLCEKRRFFMARREKGVVPIIYFEKERGKSF